ncbi:hypothetical protein [Streptomyces sp. NRRL S-920]|uniref:hypothetical protein n=1 Tax=Streptomyces sp. NRRL S-920 TaxID=1463921 RepID=UPI000D135C9A|nr:hypothetical protein [Streptomyces sp. NRRL S-920]
MAEIWLVGLVATALLVALIAVVEKVRNRPARNAAKTAPGAPRRGEAESWVAGGAVAGCGGGMPGWSAPPKGDSSCDGSSSSCGDGDGGGCGGCGCGG